MKPFKLHLGSGTLYLFGYVNVDSSRNVIADIYRDLNNPLPFEDDSVDEVLMNHTLEHIDKPEKLMGEIHRVCKNGAKITISVPHWSMFTAFGDLTHRHSFSSLIFNERFYYASNFKIKSIKFDCYSREKTGIFKILYSSINFLLNLSRVWTEMIWCKFLPVSEMIFELEVVK
jgi:SAM-dependent methyltransferase